MWNLLCSTSLKQDSQSVQVLLHRLYSICKISSCSQEVGHSSFKTSEKSFQLCPSASKMKEHWLKMSNSLWTFSNCFLLCMITRARMAHKWIQTDCKHIITVVHSTQTGLKQLVEDDVPLLHALPLARVRENRRSRQTTKVLLCSVKPIHSYPLFGQRFSKSRLLQSCIRASDPCTGPEWMLTRQSVWQQSHQPDPGPGSSFPHSMFTLLTWVISL